MRFSRREWSLKSRERFSELGRRTLKDPSAAFLVAANLIAAPLALLTQGGAASLLFVYWAETAIIGGLNIVKFYLVPPRAGTALDRFPIAKWTLVFIGRTLVALVFVVHYGLFAFLTGGLLLGLGPWGFSLADSRMPPFGDVLLVHLWPVTLIAASHVWSLAVNYIGRGEYRSGDIEDLMARPYKRLTLMVVLVWPGVIFAGHFDAPVVAMAMVFVPLKVVLDLVAYFRNHH